MGKGEGFHRHLLWGATGWGISQNHPGLLARLPRNRGQVGFRRDLQRVHTWFAAIHHKVSREW